MKSENDKQTLLDQEFKAIVHNGDVLSMLLRYTLEEFVDKDFGTIKDCLNIGADNITVIGRETEYHDPEDGSIVTDSVFTVKIPNSDENIEVIVNVEGQNDPSPGYPLGKRAEYYLGRMVSAQKGSEFSGSDYDELRKVYSIWYILNPKAAYRNTVTRYKMMAESLAGDPNRYMEPLDTFNIIMVFVGPYGEELPEISAIPAALFSPMKMEKRKEVVKDKFKISLDDAILGRIGDMITLDEETYNHGFREGKAEGLAEGKAEGLAEGKVEGLSEGLAKGKAEGLSEGLAKGKTEGAKQVLVSTLVHLVKDRGMTIEEASTYLQIPDDLSSEILDSARHILK